MFKTFFLHGVSFFLVFFLFRFFIAYGADPNIMASLASLCIVLYLVN